MNANQLINDLIQSTHQAIKEVEQFKTYDKETLLTRVNHKSWNVLECIEHLNFFGKIYIEEMDKQISKAKHRAIQDKPYKPGWLGNYFANSVGPNQGMKIKTLKKMNPINQELSKETLNSFLEQQKKILELLERAKKVDLSKTTAAISISKFIKLKLGDTFRIVVQHNHRHILQANLVLKALQEVPS